MTSPEPPAGTDPVLDEIGRQLVAGVGRWRVRRRRRRAVGAAALAVVAAVAVTAGVLATQGRPRGTALTTDSPATTATSTPTSTSTSTSTDEAGATGPLRLVDRHGRELSDDDATRGLTTWVGHELARDPRFLGGDDEAARQALVDGGGLVVRTTLDADAQQLAAATRQAVLRTEARLGPTIVAALVAVDPASGELRAVLGDVDQSAGEPDPGHDRTVLNVAFDAQLSPKLAFTPVVLAAAFGAGGFLPTDIIDGTGPCRFTVPPGTQPQPYVVTNRGRGAVGPVGAQVVGGSECALSRLAYATGLDRVADTAVRLGLEPTPGAWPLVRSIPLGAVSVTINRLAATYATLAAGGVHRDPVLIDQVTRGGTTLYRRPPSQPTSPLTADAACRVTSVLRTARPPALDGQPAVGVSAEYRSMLPNGWYAGYTPDLAAVAWVGDVHLALNVPGEGVSSLPAIPDANDLAARIWTRFTVGYRKQLAPTTVPFPTCAAPDRAPRRIPSE